MPAAPAALRQPPRPHWRVRKANELLEKLTSGRAPEEPGRRILFEAALSSVVWFLAQAVATLDPPGAAGVLAPPELLLPPHGQFELISETWAAGPAVDRRERALRKVSPYITRRMTPSGGLGLGPATVELSYPKSVKAPAIEGMS